MGTSCSYHRDTFENSPQLILDNLGLNAYPLQIDSKLYTHCPSKPDISKHLVQQSKEFIDDEIIESNNSFTNNFEIRSNSMNTKKDSLNTSIKTETLIETETKKGILKQSNEKSKQTKPKQKKVRFYTKSKFKQ